MPGFVLAVQPAILQAVYDLLKKPLQYEKNIFHLTPFHLY